MSDKNDKVRLGAAQLAEVFMDREETIEKDCEYIARAGERDIDLLVFPEFHVPAAPSWHRYSNLSFREYYTQLFENAVTVPGPSISRIREAADDANVAVVLGVTEKEPQTAATMWNSQVYIDADGSLLGVRRKLVPTKVERLFHTGGTGQDMCTFDSSIGTLGGLMCGEHSNHLACYSMVGLGESIHAASWPAFAEYDRKYRENIVGIRTRYQALTGGVPAVAASGVITEDLVNAIGSEEVEVGKGTSFIVDPMGQYLTDIKWSGEGIVHADVDMVDRTRSKAVHDIRGHYNRFDIFSLQIDRSTHDPITTSKSGDH